MGVLIRVKMLAAVVFSLALAQAAFGQDDGIRCGECIMEMHRFGGIIHANGDVLAEYLAENYCPTIEEEHQEGCPAHLAEHYPDMLGAVVHRFISSDEGARHMCTTMGACHPKQRKFTCDECVAGMEWIEAYLEDPIFQAEALLYLENHWCDEKPRCMETLQRHFIPMHVMVAEKFMIPTDICNSQFAACNPDWTTHPPHSTHPHPTHPRM